MTTQEAIAADITRAHGLDLEAARILGVKGPTSRERTRGPYVERIRAAGQTGPESARALIEDADRLYWGVVVDHKWILHRRVKADSDSLHEALLGMIKAAHRFDPKRRIKFEVYARAWIRDALDLAPDLSVQVYVPTRGRRRRAQLQAAMKGLNGHASVEAAAKVVGCEGWGAQRLLASHLEPDGIVDLADRPVIQGAAPWLLRALEDLPEVQREALVRRHLAGDSDAEIAQRLGVEAGAVGGHIDAAVEALQGEDRG